jgi:DNA-binding MarR family transcriptional regulator
MIEIVKTHHALLGAVADCLKPFDLSEPLFNILRILRGGGGLRVQEIRARMVTRVPDMTRLLDRLEKPGHVRRCRIGADRRVVLIRITDKGLKKLAAIDRPFDETTRAMTAHLTESELRGIITMMKAARREAP